jgi:hypothetical protein
MHSWRLADISVVSKSKRDLQLSRRATEKAFWALRACAITRTVHTPVREVREEAEHDTPSGTCSLHTHESHLLSTLPQSLPKRPWDGGISTSISLPPAR